MQLNATVVHCSLSWERHLNDLNDELENAHVSLRICLSNQI